MGVVVVGGGLGFGHGLQGGQQAVELVLQLLLHQLLGAADRHVQLLDLLDVLVVVEEGEQVVDGLDEARCVAVLLLSHHVGPADPPH